VNSALRCGGPGYSGRITVKKLFGVLLAMVVLLVAAACGGSSSAAGKTAPANSTAAASTAEATPDDVGTVTDPAAWCAIIIDENTKNGLMKDKAYIPDNSVKPSDLVKYKDEMIARKAEILAATPKDIHTAMKAELDYWAAAKADIYAPLGAFTADRAQQLKTFESTNCKTTGGG
jgi:hypothetical protein